MSRFDNLKLAWRYAIKEAIWLGCRHRPGPDLDIALFSSRRSGSTWLMEVIAANRGIRYIDQPFSLYRPAPGHINQLPIAAGSQFTSLEGEDEVRVRLFVEHLLDGTLLVNAPWEIWHPTFHRITNRVLLKITDAKPLIDWFAQTFPLHIIYSTRHPIPAALSVLRNGWGLTAQTYLRDTSYAESNFTEQQITQAWDLLRSGSLLEQHVLTWTLENIIPLRLLPDRPDWTYVSYEEAVLNPIATVKHLADILGLQDYDRMQRQAATASRSTRKLSSTFDEAEESARRLSAWRRHITPEDERAAFRILDLFEIDCYRFGEDLPTLSR